MRLFVALDLDPALRERVADAIRQLQEADGDAAWTRPENLHVTLKFLGEIPGSDLALVKEGVQAAVAGMPAFPFSLEGLGFFGSPRQVRIVWMGMRAGEDDCKLLMNRLDAQLDRFRKDDLPHAVHLTLGRPRSGRNREALLQKLHDLQHQQAGTGMAREIVLKESSLSGGGPRYAAVAAFRLEG
ncbi:MAG: RNA 2',3'-cyclic phosphodiesterase [Candidatus Aenigmarchaeota archaeon]|nr:RNA 2',3'-cyclic phosphodiesterase [Candidatus Aenigmarchaeota archaeon]